MRRLGGRAGRAERGASAVIVALLLSVIGGFAALVINVGHLMTVRSQLQNACDAAALAGAQELNGTQEALGVARDSAVDFAARHGTDRGQPVEIDRYTDVQFGSWDTQRDKRDAFTPIDESEPGAAVRINAVRVTAGREESRGNPLEVFLPAFTGGKTTARSAAEAVAAGGAPCEDCSVPLVFAECQVKTDEALNCGSVLVFHNDTDDNVGFTNLTDGDPSVNTAGIVKTLQGDCQGVAVGDDIGVGNGNNLNNHVVKAFNDFISRNGPKVTAPIVASPDGCPAKFNQLQEVVGFATFTILEVIGPPNHSIRIRMDCEEVDEEPSPAVGCNFYGTNAPRPVLVR